VTECKRIICLQLCHFVRRGLSVHIIVSFSEAGREWLRWTRCMAGIIGEWSTCRSDWRLASLHFAVQKTTVLIKVQQQSQQQELPPSAGTRKVKLVGCYWSKRQWVAVAPAGPYAILHLAVDRSRASTSVPPLSFYRLDALPATQPTAAKHW